MPSGQLMEQMPIAAKPHGKLGERHYFNYKQWVSLLEQEANTLVQNPRENVNVLLGDSISLWFPPQLLPPEKYWLNQGISGETSQGLLKRLNLLDRTQPEKIYLMIGINDLIKGISKEEIATNHQKIVRQLLKVHPESKIILISILPHGGQKTTWEGKDKLLKIPITEIQDLNRQLAQIAKEGRG
ncbi:MAG: hypothetical protein HC796_09075 [Synechococcaceae cyanobacterium RL_1_2]|nr:hypothetical protein [Synechococcaceae cyanobacterium RL_1_2]